MHATSLATTLVVLLALTAVVRADSNTAKAPKPVDTACAREYWTLEGLNANWMAKYFSFSDNRSAVCTGSIAVYDPTTYAIVQTINLPQLEVTDFYDDRKGCYGTLNGNLLQEEYGRRDEPTRTCLVSYTIENEGKKQKLVEDTTVTGERVRTPWPLIDSRRWVQRSTGRMTSLEWIYVHGQRTNLVETLLLATIDPVTQAPTQHMALRCVTA